MILRVDERFRRDFFIYLFFYMQTMFFGRSHQDRVISQDPQMANLQSQGTAGVERAVTKTRLRCINYCNSETSRKTVCQLKKNH